MIIIVTDYCIVVDFLEETSFQIYEVFSLNVHYVHEALHQALDFLIVVQFICDNGGHC